MTEGERKEYVVVPGDHVSGIKVVGAKDIHEAQEVAGEGFGCLAVDARYYSGYITEVRYA